MRLLGILAGELVIALRRRSPALSMALFPSSTICRDGSDFVASLSTSMLDPSNSIGTTVITLATISIIS